MKLDITKQFLCQDADVKKTLRLKTCSMTEHLWYTFVNFLALHGIWPCNLACIVKQVSLFLQLMKSLFSYVNQFKKQIEFCWGKSIHENLRWNQMILLLNVCTISLSILHNEDLWNQLTQLLNVYNISPFSTVASSALSQLTGALTLGGSIPHLKAKVTLSNFVHTFFLYGTFFRSLFEFSLAYF